MSYIKITVHDEDGDPVTVETNEDEGVVEITETLTPENTEVSSLHTPDQARQLAKALLMAADAVEDKA